MNYRADSHRNMSNVSSDLERLAVRKLVNKTGICPLVSNALELIGSGKPCLAHPGSG